MGDSRHIVATLNSQFGDYIVVDTIYNHRPARVLFSQPSNAAQSGQPLDDNPRLLFNYNQRFLEFALDILPSKILVLGGGTLTLPVALRDSLENVSLVVVEQNLDLIKLAQDYFGYQPTKQLKLVISDAKQYLVSSKQKFDLIIVDLYNDYSIPDEFQEPDFYRLVHKHLTSSGYLAINVISGLEPIEANLLKQIAKSIKRVFLNYRLIQADTDRYFMSQNILVMASKNNYFNDQWFGNFIEPKLVL